MNARYHFTDGEPFTVRTAEGEVKLGKGWLAITEEEYAALHRANTANSELVAHLCEQITHAEIRILDGTEMGASIWRIALEDVVQENRAVLAKIAGDAA